MSTVATPTLDRILDPVSRALNAEAARSLVGLRLDAKAQVHIDRLARKCNEGTLDAEERAEYEMNVLAGEFLALLQAKARTIAKRRANE